MTLNNIKSVLKRIMEDNSQSDSTYFPNGDCVQFRNNSFHLYAGRLGTYLACYDGIDEMAGVVYSRQKVR